MHEFVLSARSLKREHGVSALDVAKRLMDYGFHPPTIYFPLVVPEALMIEPTETEAKETLDEFAEAMLAIALEAKDDPDILRDAPHGRPFVGSTRCWRQSVRSSSTGSKSIPILATSPQRRGSSRRKKARRCA